MPTESKIAAPEFNLSDADGGRGYIAHLFKTVLRRHDYRQYITERLAGDFACTLAQHFEDIKAREMALQQRLTAADERADVLEGLLRRSMLAMSRIYEAGRDFIVGSGSDCDSVELMMENDPTACEIRAALKPADTAKCERCGCSTVETCDERGCGYLGAGNGAPE